MLVGDQAVAVRTLDTLLLFESTKDVQWFQYFHFLDKRLWPFNHATSLRLSANSMHSRLHDVFDVHLLIMLTLEEKCIVSGEKWVIEDVKSCKSWQSIPNTEEEAGAAGKARRDGSHKGLRSSESSLKISSVMRNLDSKSTVSIYDSTFCVNLLHDLLIIDSFTHGESQC